MIFTMLVLSIRIIIKVKNIKYIILCIHNIIFIETCT